MPSMRTVLVVMTIYLPCEFQEFQLRLKNATKTLPTYSDLQQLTAVVSLMVENGKGRPFEMTNDRIGLVLKRPLFRLVDGRVVRPLALLESMVIIECVTKSKGKRKGVYRVRYKGDAWQYDLG